MYNIAPLVVLIQTKQPAIMEVFELCSFVLLAIYKIMFKVNDFVLGKLRIQILRGSTGKHFVYILHVCLYLHLLQISTWKDDDIFVAYCSCLNALVTLKFASRLYWPQVGHVVWASVTAYGWKRCIIYGISVCSVALLLVYMFTSALSWSWNAFGDDVRGRLEDNIIEIEEDRTHFAMVMIHPITQGKTDPRLFHKVYRYPMEDVKMTCKIKKVWLSDGRPSADQVSWRRNGAPFTLTDRYDHEITFREISEHESVYHSFLRKRGISEYEINATLTIQLLRPGEFGSYTCHLAKYFNLTLEDFIANMEKMNNGTDEDKGESSKSKEDIKTTVDTATLIEEERTRLSDERKKALEPKRMFKDVFTWKGEFRLVKMSHRQETVRSPPSSILSFTTRYWHLMAKEDIEIDYSVNGKSFHQLCEDPFHGCSKVLLLYWLLGHARGGMFGMPPLHLFTIWANPAISAEQFTLTHCLCENSYGYHSVRYLRRYYNRTTSQHELIEIMHPHELVVVPREQHLLNVFVNRSECSHVIERPPCEEPPLVCLSFWDFRLIRAFAETAVSYFRLSELVVIVVIFIVALVVIRNINGSLSYLGRVLERLTLDGAMGFYWTAIENNNNLQQRQNTSPYDLFLSYSETEADTKRVHEDILPFLERQGFRVCARCRDIPPNVPEVHGISKAIENSSKVIVFLSEGYFQSSFLTDIEAPIIIESFCERRGSAAGPQDVLLVKLEPCEVPPWLSRFLVHDWAPACLSLADHRLKLLKWLEPPERRATFRSLVDALVTLLPLLLVLVAAVTLLAAQSVPSAALPTND